MKKFVIPLICIFILSLFFCGCCCCPGCLKGKNFNFNLSSTPAPTVTEDTSEETTEDTSEETTEDTSEETTEDTSEDTSEETTEETSLDPSLKKEVDTLIKDLTSDDWDKSYKAQTDLDELCKEYKFTEENTEYMKSSFDEEKIKKLTGLINKEFITKEDLKKELKKLDFTDEDVDNVAYYTARYTNIPLYSYLIQDKNTTVALKGVECLGYANNENHSSEIFKILCYGTEHPSDHVRQYAIYNIYTGFSGDGEKDKSIEIVRKAFKDPSPHVRHDAIAAITWLDDKESIPVAKEMMEKDDAPEVKARAMETLDYMGEDITEELLKTAKEEIKETDPEKKQAKAFVKSWALYILANKQNKEIIPELVKLLDDETENYFTRNFDDGTPMSYSCWGGTMRETAIYCLEAITGEKFEVKDKDGWNDMPAIAEKWKEWAKKNNK